MKIGFIGTGNMGGALARAAANRAATRCCLPTEPGQGRGAGKGAGRDSLPERGGRRSGRAAVSRREAAGPAGSGRRAGSRAAGTEGECTRRRQHGDGRDAPGAGRHARRGLPLIRIMPNTPAAVGAGTILYAAQNVTDAQLSAFRAVLAQAGLLLPLPEAQIDAASAISGCGPASCFQFADALASAACARACRTRTPAVWRRRPCSARRRCSCRVGKRRTY